MCVVVTVLCFTNAQMNEDREKEKVIQIIIIFDKLYVDVILCYILRSLFFQSSLLPFCIFGGNKWLSEGNKHMYLHATTMNPEIA